MNIRKGIPKRNGADELRLAGVGDGTAEGAVCMYVCMYVVRQLKASAVNFSSRTDGQSPSNSPGEASSHPALQAGQHKQFSVATSLVTPHQPLDKTTPLSASTTMVLDLI